MNYVVRATERKNVSLERRALNGLIESVQSRGFNFKRS